MKIAATAIAVTFAIAVASGQDQQTEATLPPHFPTPTTTNRPVVVARPEGAQLQVPQGFEIDEYASGFNTPRFMLLGPGNEIIMSDSSAGSVYVLVDRSHSNKNPERKEILKGLTRPYG